MQGRFHTKITKEEQDTKTPSFYVNFPEKSRFFSKTLKLFACLRLI